MRPSLTDVLFAGILLWSFLAAEGGWGRLLRDADTGLHIRIGDFIQQTGQVPVTDPFSFTRNGAPWYATEWLSALLFSSLNAWFGLKGIVFLCGVTIVATTMIVLRTCLAVGGNALLAVILTLAGANASSVHYHARPHVFTWLFLAMAAWILTMDRTSSSGRIWLLVPLAALWVNLHGGFLILFLLLGCVLVQIALTRPLPRANLVRYVKLTAACGLACLANPFGYKLLLETLAYVRNKSILNTVSEFQAPAFRSEANTHFMLLLFAALGICGLLLARRAYGSVLLIVVLAASSLTSVRHIPIFAICVGPIVAGELTRHWSAWVATQSSRSTARAIEGTTASLRDNLHPVSLWTPVLLAAVFFIPGLSRWPADFNKELFPVGIAQRQSAALAASRVFTTDQWADYLMFKNPAQRVFLDDRYFYGDRIVEDALKLMDARPGWRGVLATYGINAVLAPPGAPVIESLTADKGWRMADKDAAGVLFRKAN